MPDYMQDTTVLERAIAADQATIDNARAMLAGGEVDNMTAEGARLTIAGCEATIANKRAMLAQSDPLTGLERDIPVSAARDAWSATSHTPDERGDQEIAAYVSQLQRDYASLLQLCDDSPDKRATLAAEFSRYRAGFRKRKLAQLAAHARCLSSHVTGPANFPARRNAKRIGTEHKRLEDMLEFRKRALAAIRKVLTPERAPIRLGDSDAGDRLQDKIAKLEGDQAFYKLVNATIRAHRKAGKEVQIAQLVAATGIPTAAAARLLEPDDFGRIGIPAYKLTNNLAEIKRLQGRLGAVERAQATPTVELDGEHARLEDSAADNRVRLFFPGKPDATVRGQLKGSGFRWAPSLGCWQAYRNTGSLAVARKIAGVA